MAGTDRPQGGDHGPEHPTGGAEEQHQAPPRPAGRSLGTSPLGCHAYPIYYRCRHSGRAPEPDAGANFAHHDLVGHAELDGRAKPGGDPCRRCKQEGVRARHLGQGN
ncbi:MAG: hypothetical protein MI748_05695, partial [Opitutales bacterium]|nr:hypothetical protein [Opitutales bacterium]